MYVCGNCENPKRVIKTKQKWIINRTLNRLNRINTK